VPDHRSQLGLINVYNLVQRLFDKLNCLNEVKSVASFFCQVAAWVPDMFCNFYFVKNKKNAKNSTTPKAREKISTV